MMEKEPPEPTNPIATVVIGNIEPDMHDTAKEAVRKSLKRAGFKTIDAGKSAQSTSSSKKSKKTTLPFWHSQLTPYQQRTSFQNCAKPSRQQAWTLK
jgi:hypothetical protein